MKIWAFIKWHYRRLEVWQKIWLFGTMAFGWAWASPDHSTEQFVAFMIFVTCIGGLLAKWWFWDSIRSSYKKFQEEQQGLFDTIKNSEKL